MALYDYSIGGTTLAARQITGARCQLVNGGMDTLALTQTKDSVLAADDWEEDALVTVLKGETPVYRGRVLPTEENSEATLHRQIVLGGGWLELTRHQYCQLWMRGWTAELTTSLEDALGLSVETFLAVTWAAGPGGRVPFGRVILGADPVTYNPENPQANRITTGAQIRAIVEWAIEKGAALQIGSISDGILAPTEEASDLTCAEAITRLCRWTPGAVVWFDYSVSPAAFHFTTYDALTGADVPANSFDGSGAFRCGQNRSASLAGVVIQYRVEAKKINENVVLTLRGGRQLTFPAAALGLTERVTADYVSYAYPEGAEPGAARVAALTFETDDMATEPDLTVAGYTLARAIYEQANALAWRGSGTLYGDDVPRTVGLGRKLNITGGRAEWATMGAPIQAVTDVWERGRRILTWGPPRQLGSADLAALLAANRRRRPATRDQQKQQGTGGSDESWSFGGDKSTSTTEDYSEEEITFLTKDGFKKITLQRKSSSDALPTLPEHGTYAPTWSDRVPAFTEIADTCPET
jgi:hypothetical protein